mgnify:CR=1 FL=1
MTNAQKYKDCLEYIDKYWNEIIFKPSRLRLKYSFINIPTFLSDTRSNPHLLYVPNTYFVPNLGAQKRICYWDSYFMFRGIIGTKREPLMKNMVDNLTYLFDKYQIIPNFNAPASINRSQPPFLTSMIKDVYAAQIENRNGLKKLYKTKDMVWLKKSVNIAKKEYETVWIDNEKFYNHSVKGYILSRYGDRDIGYAHSSELESGWDMTSRFYNRCDQFLPIDLNSYLYKYELDFAYFAKLFGNFKEADYWNSKSEIRKNEINNLMWDEKEKFFFDYGYSYKQLSSFRSLASYTPLWAGLATPVQAKHMVDRLSEFETPYGLTICTKDSLAKPIDLKKIQKRFYPAIEDIIKPKQWDYPNIWSPLEYLTVIGLLKYEFITDAKRIMENSVNAHAAAYKKHKTFFEKLDGTTGDSGSGALYGDQKGFGWTNAVFYRYVKLLDLIKNNEPLYSSQESSEPPYELSID